MSDAARMGARQKDWARRTREVLFDLLGRRCQWCGAGQDVAKLTFDVIVPETTGGPTGNGHHRKMDWSGRMSFYRRENDRGNLQVLCDSCNGKKADTVTVVESEFPHFHQPF